MRVGIAVLRARPFLILGILALGAFLVSLTWERGTSYDDGGLGTLSFLIEFTIGLPFLLPTQALAHVGAGLGSWLGYGAWIFGGIIGVTFYGGLDRFSMRWVKAWEARRRAAA